MSIYKTPVKKRHILILLLENVKKEDAKKQLIAHWILRILHTKSRGMTFQDLVSEFTLETEKERTLLQTALIALIDRHEVKLNADRSRIYYKEKHRV